MVSRSPRPLWIFTTSVFVCVEVLPDYLIPVVAAAVPVVIAIVIIVCVVGVCLRCRRPKKGKLEVNAPKTGLKVEESR